MNKTCCDQLVECLSEYIDGDLPPELVAQLEEHMSNCTDCRIVVDTTKKTISLYQQMTEDQHIPNSVVERLHKTLDISNFMKD